LGGRTREAYKKVRARQEIRQKKTKKGLDLTGQNGKHKGNDKTAPHGRKT